MRPTLALALIVVALAGGVAMRLLAARDALPRAGVVVRVLDGDTYDVRTPSGTVRVRLLGVDTPEIRHRERPGACFGPEAAAVARRWLLGARVQLRIGVQPHDKYGRLLADVLPVTGALAGRDLATALARRGLARDLLIAPNDQGRTALRAVVAAARGSGLGLWGACGWSLAFPGKRL